MCQYKWYILPIGGLYGTYHPLRKLHWSILQKMIPQVPPLGQVCVGPAMHSWRSKTSKTSWRSAKATMEAIRALQQQLMEVQQKGIFAANGNWPLLLELRLRYSKIGKHKFKSLYLELNYGIQIDPERTQIWKDMRYLVFSRYIQIICNHFLFFEFRSQPCQAQKASNVRKISERNCSWKWHFVEGTSLWFSGKWPHWKGEDFKWLWL